MENSLLFGYEQYLFFSTLGRLHTSFSYKKSKISTFYFNFFQNPLNEIWESNGISSNKFGLKMGLFRWILYLKNRNYRKNVTLAWCLEFLRRMTKDEMTLVYFLKFVKTPPVRQNHDLNYCQRMHFQKIFF